MEEIYKQFTAWMPVMKMPNGSFMGILSDNSIDRDDEFMTEELLQEWSQIKGVKALINHENKMEKWVGGWKGFRLIKNGEHTALIAEPWFFNKEANPLAEQVKKQIEQALDNGENAGISIGALPTKHIDKEINGIKHRGYVKAELLEGTWVPIQSNRNAVSFKSIAKQFNLDMITKPKEVEECVRALMNDENFHPKDGKTKEESAWAVCQSRYNKTIKEEHKMEDSDKMQECMKQMMSEGKSKEEAQTVCERKMKETEVVVQKENNEEILKKEIETLKKQIEELNTKNKELDKQKEELNNKVVLKATVEGPISVPVDNSPLTIEKMLKMKYGGK